MSTTILRGGTVIDPGSRTATVADVVIRDGRVAEVAELPVLAAASA